MAFLGFAIAALLIGAFVAAARWAVSRAFGVRAKTFRGMVDTDAERGRPALAFTRAVASVAGMYLACVVLFIIGFASGGKIAVDEVSMRVTVLKSGPAAEAGITDGDRIVSVNGEAVTDWDQLKKLVAAHPNETITVDVDRAGEKKTFSVETVGPKMMVAPFIERKSLSAGDVLAESFVAPLQVVRSLARGFVRMIVGTEKTELAGPVGVGKEVAAAAKDGAGTFFKLVAALASYQGAIAGLVLLAAALVTSILPRRNSVLPTADNPS